MAKYYEYKIEYQEITPELRQKYLSVCPGRRQQIEIAKPLGVSAETIRKVFKHNPERVNKRIWDGIVKWVEAK